MKDIVESSDEKTNINQEEALRSEKSIVTVVYALQAVSFLLGITALIAIIISYVKRADVKGTWLESHYRWQIRTFWFGLLWLIIGVVTLLIWLGYIVLMVAYFWVMYRVVRGWLRLASGKKMYA